MNQVKKQRNTPSITVFELGQAVSYIFRHHGMAVERTRLNDGLSRVSEQADQLSDVVQLLDAFDLSEPELLPRPDAARLPLLAYQAQQGWGVLSAQEPDGRYVFKQSRQTLHLESGSIDTILAISVESKNTGKFATFTEMLGSKLGSYRGVVFEAVIATLIINVLALTVSLFSMQVYDRVIPTRSEYTLIILATGVALVILLEIILKLARSKIMDRVMIGLDLYLSREVFQRLLKVRMDQMPHSVGSLAGQLRAYEQVRSFFTASTIFALADIPMAALALLLMIFIGSPWVAVVPLALIIISLTLGFLASRKINTLANQGAVESYRKTGILVETVEGMETIKAGAGSYKFLSRWLDINNITIMNDLKLRKVNDHLNYTIQMLQQLSYIGIIIIGSFVVMNGGMTMGALIACSILGGRILAPILQIPNLLVQYSHSQAAKRNIENLYELEQENHNVKQPLLPSRLYGHYIVEKMTFNYKDNEQHAVNIDKLEIKAGEKIAILGSIGSGKSTLLKILSGLYVPTTGRILLDGLDMTQISHEVLHQQLGYLQQDHRLFQGTLRENLLIGMAQPHDDIMQNVLGRTGLIKLVNGHSSGMDLPISEGGKGLSGGQKQLVAFTRLVLTKPHVLLLDEPTASMDNAQEAQCIKVLSEELERGQTLIVSTHKPSILEIVDRIIIMENGKIILDGTKQAVLDHLKENERKLQRKEAKKTPASSLTDDAHVIGVLPRVKSRPTPDSQN